MITGLKVDGKRPECRESLMIDVRCGRRSSRQWVRKDVAEDLVHTYLLWIDSVFSSLYFRRQIERHPRLCHRKVDQGQKVG